MEYDFTTRLFFNGNFAITAHRFGQDDILDALCSAVRTDAAPDKVREQHEIMSRQAGKCFTEVTFETRKAAIAATGTITAPRRPDRRMQLRGRKIRCGSDKVL